MSPRGSSCPYCSVKASSVVSARKRPPDLMVESTITTGIQPRQWSQTQQRTGGPAPERGSTEHRVDGPSASRIRARRATSVQRTVWAHRFAHQHTDQQYGLPLHASRCAQSPPSLSTRKSPRSSLSPVLDLVYQLPHSQCVGFLRPTRGPQAPTGQRPPRLSI